MWIGIRVRNTNPNLQRSWIRIQFRSRSTTLHIPLKKCTVDWSPTHSGPSTERFVTWFFPSHGVSEFVCNQKESWINPCRYIYEYLPIFERYGTNSFASSGVKLNKCSLFQSAFMTLLGDPNDLVQDAASKGIGIVYDNCSEADREKMVGSLLDTILGGRKEVNKVRAPSWSLVLRSRVLFRLQLYIMLTN